MCIRDRGYSGNTLAHLTVEEGTLAFTGGATIGVNPNNATIVLSLIHI